MKLKVRELGKGLNPQEVLVEIKAADGGKRMIIDKRSLDGEFVLVGCPLSKSDGQLLIELPRETTIGEWRVWVPNDQLAAA